MAFTDPGNPLFKPAYGSAGQSVGHVPGDVIWEPSPGFAQVWPLWRRNLAELAPLLFQAKSK